ncbi:kinesin-like protein KIF20B [Gadus chalcogrammus]|uniref:kinesin-like protein KIF20B n=1 Tax=Gadus chalcogrammus TaxID=1042646 RepID=UPI0024C483FF|nr:kinesin-like protein KIF20B [Gadus chalcogrammus]
MLLIGQAKEAEEKRNQEMRKFAEDRERHAREHIQLESVCAELAVKEQEMGQWRRERDSLVSALEVQLLKLLSCNKEQEQLIEQLRADPGPPPETTLDSTSRSSAERTSSGSAGFPSVLESSQISTENGRRSRFPRPEMEISFSPLQPNRLALRRQGEQDSVTVKISRPRKRRSNDMDRDEVEVENKINTKTKLTPKQEEGPSPGGGSVTRSRKDGALLRIGDFLQSSPTLFTSGAKKVMSLVSSSSSSSVRVKKSKKKLYQPHISSPMDLPSNPIIPEEKDSDHLIIKRRLRSRTAK